MRPLSGLNEEIGTLPCAAHDVLTDRRENEDQPGGGCSDDMKTFLLSDLPAPRVVFFPDVNLNTTLRSITAAAEPQEQQRESAGRPSP